MTPKLTTGDTITNLKYYMFITNEYGKPSKNSIDLFIESFGTIILNGNFSRYMTEIIEVQLNHWWSEITLDLEERELKSLAKYNGGFDWFKHIAREGKKLRSKLELEEYIGSETCDIDFERCLADKNIDTQEETEIIASEIKDDTTYELSSTETSNITLYKLIQNTPYKQLNIKGNMFCDIISDTEIKLLDDRVMNIGEYIYENNILDLNSIRMGIRPFYKIFEEIKK